ncbi:hypothetical protein BDA96_07G042500 [Sorghum bicolor]|uniref:Uncharacterized protein n=2 Tax=Sorghum bicolor TaxID=4558 RepID=A0A921QKG8_SORBI|nr:hypothetical protein BDA96_07G042500 [Sorghum bicolor]KXG24424.1 hypothetical protein SORBI_3007G040200 [Sorghum bicolor]
MEKCLKHTSIHGLLLLSMILLASSVVIHARIPSGQTKEDTNDARSVMMTTMRVASNKIANNGEASSVMPASGIYPIGSYVCSDTGTVYSSFPECVAHCIRGSCHRV